MFKLQMRTMDLLLLLGLILTGAPRAADGKKPVTVKVREGHEAILPCSVSTNMESEIFAWKNKDNKEVFFYDKNDRTGNESGAQLKDFNDRAFHFKDQLKNGNASIRITNTKMADSGAYNCCFRFQEECCHVELVVACHLKDRTAETPGVCPKPHFTHLKSTQTWDLLQCEVHGVSPDLQLQIKDSSGTVLSDQPKKEPKGGGTYDMVLETNATRSGVYSCVVTQEDICHQIFSNTSVHVNEPTAEPKDSTTSNMASGAAVASALLFLNLMLIG